MSLAETLDQVLPADAVLVLAEPAALLGAAERKAVQLFVELGGSLLVMSTTGKALSGACGWCTRTVLGTSCQQSLKACGAGQHLGGLLEPYGMALLATPQLSLAPSEHLVHPRMLLATAAAQPLQEALSASQACRACQACLQRAEAIQPQHASSPVSGTLHHLYLAWHLSRAWSAQIRAALDG